MDVYLVDILNNRVSYDNTTQAILECSNLYRVYVKEYYKMNIYANMLNNIFGDIMEIDISTVDVPKEFYYDDEDLRIWMEDYCQDFITCTTDLIISSLPIVSTLELVEPKCVESFYISTNMNEYLTDVILSSSYEGEECCYATSSFILSDTMRYIHINNDIYDKFIQRFRNIISVMGSEYCYELAYTDYDYMKYWYMNNVHMLLMI